MSERKIEGILECLCGDIISKAEQREVRDELYDHLMSVFETNLDSISATSEFYTHEKTNKEYVEYLNEKYNS